MLITFSNDTAALLKAELAEIEPLNGPNQNETPLDFSKLKKLNGCRTDLTINWLTCIQKLDQLTQQEAKEKYYALEKIKTLIAAFKHYKTSCEHYPRLKDFLNIIPDNTDDIVGFILIASGFLAYLSPAFIVIPLFIISWIVLDLVFNNRTAAKTFEASIGSTKEELNVVYKANSILKAASQLTETPIASDISLPSSSRAYSSGFYSSTEHQGNENNSSPSNSMFASFSSTSSS